MTEEYDILQVEWEYRIVQDQSGKKKKIIRGVDYDTSWIKLGEGFAKRGNEITFYDKKKFSKLYKTIDFTTFELIQSHNATTHYFKDKNNVYIDSYMDKDLTVLERANPKNFKILDIENGYSTSGNTDYWYGVKIPFRLKDADNFGGSFYQKVEIKSSLVL